MRQPNHMMVNNNRPALVTTPNTFGRRALDCTSTLPLLTTLINLQRLTIHSAPTRTRLCEDGGIERLVRILQQKCKDDRWDRELHTLARQCVCNVGIRGDESTRRRVVEAEMVSVVVSMLTRFLRAAESLDDKEKRKKESARQVQLADRHGATDIPIVRRRANTLGAALEPRNIPRSLNDSPTAPDFNTFAFHQRLEVFIQHNNRAHDRVVALTLPQPSPTAEGEMEVDRSPAVIPHNEGDSVTIETDQEIPALSNDIPRFLNTATGANPLEMHDMEVEEETEDDAILAVASPPVQVQQLPIEEEAMRSVSRPVIQNNANNGAAPLLPSPDTVVDVVAPVETTEVIIPTQPGPPVFFTTARVPIAASPPPNTAPPDPPARPHYLHVQIREANPCPECAWRIPSQDEINVSLQLLAYISKYPSLKPYFFNCRLMFNLLSPWNRDGDKEEVVNAFSVVEKFTEPAHHPDVSYWAGITMRNYVRKDEGNGGRRQCAYLGCQKWESGQPYAKCKRCRKAKYCGKECQSKAWMGHRHWCTDYTETHPERTAVEVPVQSPPPPVDNGITIRPQAASVASTAPPHRHHHNTRTQSRTQLAAVPLNRLPHRRLQAEALRTAQTNAENLEPMQLDD